MSNIHQKALSYLARREHSRLQLQNKLLDDGFEKEAIDTVLAALAEEGLQSDQRFAENHVRNRKRSGFGPERIVYELEHDGINKAIIQTVVNFHSPDWVQQINTAIVRRFPNSVGQFLQQKARFLANRGYTADDIARYLNREQVSSDD